MKKTKYPIVIETFRPIGGYEVNNLTQTEESCFNGGVHIEKYRITIEKINEPNDVLVKRLRKLWSECRNHHHWQPLKAWAKTLGVELSYDELPKR